MEGGIGTDGFMEGGLCTCAARSLDGTTIKALSLGTTLVIRLCTIGTQKHSVFPEPVGAHTQTSRSPSQVGACPGRVWRRWPMTAA